MKRIAFVGVGILFALSLAGCATAPAPQQSQLEIREYQTRMFDTANQKQVMKALIGALQDDGFVISQANTDLGLLTAQKEINVRNAGTAFVATLLAGNDATYQNNATMEATANVSAFGKQTRVRLNVAQKIMDNKGGVMDVQPISDPKFYQDFFETVSKSLFIQHEKL
jgi:hypothetical protein